MKKIYALLVVSVSFSAAVIAQPNSAVPKNIRAANTLDNLFDANGLSLNESLWGIPLEPGEVVGNAYLNASWKRTALLLYDGEKMLEGYATRYEIDQDQFEIKTAGGIKVLSGKRVKSFVWVDSLSRTPHYFVNGRDLRTEANVPVAGFFEVLTEGDFTLLTKTKVVVKKPTYNSQLDMGVRDTRIEKKTEFYFLHNNVLRELPSQKKKILALFGDRADEAGKFIKVNSLSLDSEVHLQALFEHCNSLSL